MGSCASGPIVRRQVGNIEISTEQSTKPSVTSPINQTNKPRLPVRTLGQTYKQSPSPSSMQQSTLEHPITPTLKTSSSRNSLRSFLNRASLSINSFSHSINQSLSPKSGQSTTQTLDSPVTLSSMNWDDLSRRSTLITVNAVNQSNTVAEYDHRTINHAMSQMNIDEKATNVRARGPLLNSARDAKVKQSISHHSNNSLNSQPFKIGFSARRSTKEKDFNIQKLSQTDEKRLSQQSEEKRLSLQSNNQLSFPTASSATFNPAELTSINQSNTNNLSVVTDYTANNQSTNTLSVNQYDLTPTRRRSAAFYSASHQSSNQTNNVSGNSPVTPSSRSLNQALNNASTNSPKSASRSVQASSCVSLPPAPMIPNQRVRSEASILEVMKSISDKINQSADQDLIAKTRSKYRSLTPSIHVDVGVISGFTRCAPSPVLAGPNSRSSLPQSLGSSFTQLPVCCAKLHCEGCRMDVMMLDHQQWSPSCTGAVFEQFYPNVSELRAYLVPRQGTRAYCCSCSWISCSMPTVVTEDVDLPWTCAGHQ